MGKTEQFISKNKCLYQHADISVVLQARVTHLSLVLSFVIKTAMSEENIQFHKPTANFEDVQLCIQTDRQRRLFGIQTEKFMSEIIHWMAWGHNTPELPLLRNVRPLCTPKRGKVWKTHCQKGVFQ